MRNKAHPLSHRPALHVLNQLKKKKKKKKKQDPSLSLPKQVST